MAAPEVAEPPLRRDRGLSSRYTAADLDVFTEAERRRYLREGADPHCDIELAWELLYRREPRLYDPKLTDEENERIFGKCARLHGHNYVLEVIVGGELDASTGYVVDLKRVAEIMERRIIRDVDHRNLNTDVPWLADRIPTAENLALACWERMVPELPEGSLRSVRIWETDKNWAEVGGGS